MKKILLLILLVFGIGNAFGQNKYTLVSSASQLEAGAKYLIVNSAVAGTAKALGNQNTNNRREVDVNIANVSSIMTITTTVASSNSITDKPFELTLGGNSSAWTLQDAANGNNYLWASGGTGGSTNNYLQNRAASATWSISFTSNAAIITAINPAANRNIVKYNSSGLFSCYASGQAAVYLYKLMSLAPEINLQGNSSNIISGATTVSSTNHTDFGNQDITSGSVVRTFTIQNTGSADLNLSGTPIVAISGADSSDFTVTIVPGTTVVASGNTTFQITFDPNTIGVKNATISIGNNDSDENPYTFAIQGTGTTVAPNINLQGNSANITNGSATPSVTNHTDFGSQDITSGTIVRTFTIQNTGSDALSLTGGSPYAIISGTNAADFTVTVIPATSIAAAGNTTFQVTFDPSATGTRTATITIANNDSTKNPYTFVIQGTGTDIPANPSGTISGTTPSCSSTTLTYTGTVPGGETYYWQNSATGTSVANNATATLPVTTSGNYYVRANKAGVWSTGATAAYAVVINQPVNITGQPNSTSVQIPNAKTFTVAATGTPTPTYQWQVSTDNGGNWNNVSTGSGGNTASYTTPATTDAMNGYQYKCIVTNSCNSVTSNVATLALTNSAPNNAGAVTACFGNTTVELNWTAATGTPTGYIVFAIQSTAVPNLALATAGNAVDYVANNDFSLANTYTTLGKAVYKGSGTSATITGLTLGATYTYKVVAYKSETITGWAPGIATTATTSAWVVYNSTAKTPEVSTLAASVANLSTSVTWARPTPISCYEYIVVANQGGPVVFTPSGDGTSYTANPAYAGSNQVVYKGAGNSAPVTGLTNGLSYCYKVFVRKTSTNEWSEGTFVCQTPNIAYCPSEGNMDANTSITNVSFNTINNSSGKTLPYQDYTSISTTLNKGEGYDLSVKVNTDGNFLVQTKAWIDWDRNGTFSAGESYDLGSATNVTDGLTSLSPLNVTVPTNAQSGIIRMRVSTKYNDVATPCETLFDGEVEDYTLNIVQSPDAEIYVKANNQNIASGSTVANPLNLTLFASQNIGVSQEKVYTVGNAGLNTLLLSGTPIISIGGTNPGDFSITQYPANSIASGSTSDFKITFTPTASGVRTAVISIANNDVTGNENPYTFLIQGTGTCATATNTIIPASGPVGTVVTITATAGNLIGATATFNGVAATVTQVSTTEIKVVVPTGATAGNLVTTNTQGCTASTAFNVIHNQSSGCENGTGVPSDLLIYEVYDENGGTGGYVSIFNGTPTSKNLSNYRIHRAGTYSNVAGDFVNYATISGTIPSGGIAIIKVIGTNQCATPASTGHGTIDGGYNATDGFQLRTSSGTIIDDVAGSNRVGYYLKRKITALTPKTTYNIADWTIVTIEANECFGTGIAPVISENLPVVTVQPIFTDKCGAAVLEVVANEGFVGGNPLIYQWFVTAPGQTAWTELVDGGVYIGATTATLTIASLTGLEHYQFYAQVRENTVTCYAATNAVNVFGSQGTVTWDGTNWVGGLPDSTKDVVINGFYNTSVSGNLQARSLANNGNITIADGNYIKIEYGFANSGTLEIKNNGSLVQVCDAVVNTGNAISMERITKPMYRYDFTYWSSPVNSQTLGALSPNTLADKYFRWDTNFQDWISTLKTSNMEKGVGYIIRAPQTFSTNPLVTAEFTGNFSGEVHNGVITVPVVGHATQEKWNLLGNPYPSAIHADKFLASSANPELQGTIYIWTHNTPLDPVPNEDGFYGYAPNDYAVYNALGGTGTSSAVVFNGYIAAGQSFFVKGNANGNATFNNSMRVAQHNTQFLRTGNAPQTTAVANRIWLNLTNSQSAFNQTLIGYVEGATNGLDRDFDGDVFGGNAVTFYSIASQRNLSIQGRALPFDKTDIVDLGYKTTTAGTLKISLANFDGIFTDQDVYLEDKALNIIHNLKASDYEFTSAVGTFNTRFVLRYTSETLGNPDFEAINNNLTVGVKDKAIIVRSTLENIQSIAIYDILGRNIYENKKVNANEFRVQEVTASQQALIVKVYLENGMQTTRKIILK